MISREFTDYFDTVIITRLKKKPVKVLTEYWRRISLSLINESSQQYPSLLCSPLFKALYLTALEKRCNTFTLPCYRFNNPVF